LRAGFLSWLGRHGWLVGIAVAYLYVFPYFPRIHSANELPRVYLVDAIAADHTFAIERGFAKWPRQVGGGPTADVSPSGGHQYSNKAPGSSMLAAPPYWLVRTIAGEPDLATAMWICRLAAGIVPMLVFLGVMYRFLARWVPDPALRQLVCVAYGLGSMAMTYSILFFSHQLGAICACTAWIFALQAAERERGVGWFAVAGTLAGCAPLVDYQAVFAVVPAAIHVAVKLWAWPLRERVRAIAIATASAAVPIAVLLAYHALCFGSPFRTGYDASVTFAANHQVGFLGLTTLRWEAFVGSLFALDNGLFALSPWLLLAFPGMYVLARGSEPAPPADRRRGTRELGGGLGAVALGLVVLEQLSGVPRLAMFVPIGAGAAVATIGARRLVRGDLGAAAVGFWVAVIYILFVSAITFWRGGWGVGPRYITAMLPFLLPAVAAALLWLRAWPRVFGAVAGTLVVGIAIDTLAAFTFPYWPDSSKHPLYEVTFRLLANGYAAPSVASAMGIDGVLGVIPVLLLVAGVTGWLLVRTAGRLGAAIAALVATLVLAGYGLAPRGTSADRVFELVRGSVEHAHAGGPVPR
jgi:hypothetical protein